MTTPVLARAPRLPHRLLLCAALCLGLSACGGSRLALHDRRSGRTADGRAAVTWHVVGGRLLAAVAERLDDEPALWVIDSGATLHALTAARAGRSGIVGPAGAQRVAVVGQDAVSVELELTRPVAVAVFAGAPPRSGSLPVLAGPSFDSMDRAGLAGLLSPQQLVADGAAIELDLRHDALLRLPASAAPRGREEVAQHGAPLVRCSFGAFDGFTLVEATIAGRPARLVVDTGTPVTTLYADSAAGIAASLHTDYRFLDAPAMRPDSLDAVAVVPRVPARVAGLTTSLRVLVRPRHGHQGCLGDGLLGLDVLAGCTLVLDATGGAVACEAPTRRETAPGLSQVQRLQPSKPLPARAAPLPAGTVARLGCTAITDGDVAAWAREHGVAAAAAREQVVRLGALELAARSLLLAVSPQQVEQAVTSLLLQRGLDETALAEALRPLHKTPLSYRAEVREQLLAAQLLAHLRADRRDPEPARALVERLRDRLARVAVERDGAYCQERWPSYFLDQVRFTGLAPTDEEAVRLALAAWLAGQDFSLGPAGLLPGRFVEAVEGVLAGRGIRPRLTAVEQERALQVTVAPSR